jgi:hypothetical protein
MLYKGRLTFQIVQILHFLRVLGELVERRKALAALCSHAFEALRRLSWSCKGYNWERKRDFDLAFGQSLLDLLIGSRLDGGWHDYIRFRNDSILYMLWNEALCLVRLTLQHQRDQISDKYV